MLDIVSTGSCAFCVDGLLGGIGLARDSMFYADCDSMVDVLWLVLSPWRQNRWGSEFGVDQGVGFG